MSDDLEERPLPSTTGPGDLLKRYWYLVVGLVVALLAYAYWWQQSAFNDIGYAPRQPIPYSHKLHAGELGIDCRYCHFNAERGKHAGAPPISVCLGCHSPEMGMAANDRPAVQKMLELTLEADRYSDDNDLDGSSDDAVKVGGVVHWNRVHKLPDHVYFSHEWHVNAGVACQTCHGPIEEMEVVEQFASLEMGWCIQCHRDDTYVGGREYDGSPESFHVGTGDYDVLRHRIRPDQVVSITHPETKGAPAPNTGKDAHADHADHDSHGGHGHDEVIVPDGELAHAGRDGEQLRGLFPEGGDDQLHNELYVSARQVKVLNEAFERYAGLPRWRIPDLPHVHVQFYQHKQDWDQDGDGKVDPEYLADIDNVPTLQNAPTQCNTCHQ